MSQVLHDGDLVEVDADKGVVRIIGEREKKSMKSSKEEILNYLSSCQMDVQNARASFFIVDLVFSAYVNSEKVHGLKFSPVLAYFKGGNNFFQIIPYENIMNVARKVYKDFLIDENSLDVKIKKHAEITKDIDKLWKNYKGRKNIANNDLLEFFRNLVKKTQDWWHYGVIGEDKGKIIDEEIVPFFEENRNINKNKANEVVSALSHPEEPSSFSLERKNYYEICLYILSNDKLKKSVNRNDISVLENNQKFMAEFNDYKNNYFYKNTDFFDGKEINLKSFVEELRSDIQKKSINKVKKEILNIENSVKEIKEKKEKIISSIKLTNEEKKLIGFSSKTINWIDNRKVGMMKQLYYIFSLLHEIAGRNNIDYDELASMSVLEVEDFLANGNKLFEKDSKKRKNWFMAIYETGKAVKIYYGEDANKIFQLSKGKLKDIIELRGVVASRGNGNKVRGVVRIINDPKNELFEEGEILVTSMTRIEFVPIMNKAKMIITNEGGITCHAAIVAREMKKPCVIGTKIATKVLHDGDLVEVDADKGVVRILERAK